jgi:hypothetical protein
MRYVLIAVLALLGQSAGAADDDTYRLMKLEQDVRNLEREVQTLNRQVDELRNQSGRERLPAGSRAPSAPAASSSNAWLEGARWDRVRVGMSELEVINLLGPPTSMRQEGDARVLLYAVEIGSSGFLGGSIELRERAVSEVHKPTLR